MGEAKTRRASQEAFRKSLSADEAIVADTALAVHRKFIVPFEATGMCYRMAFFIADYLQARHGVQAEPHVGYVNDGEGEIMASHAWVVFNGKKTNISLTRTEHPEVPTGGLLILDHVLAGGQAHYTYHDERTPEAMRALQEVIDDPRFGAIARHKEQEHLEMKARQASAAARRSYLDAAPDGFTFDRLAALIEAN